MTTKTPATPLDIIEAFMRGPGDDAVPPSLRAVSDADAAEALRTARRDRDRLVEQVKQLYAHLGWSPTKVPAHVAEEARALLRSLGEDA